MRSDMRETRIEGIGTLPQGSYETILVEGIGKGRGDLDFDAMYVEGKFQGIGRLEGRLLSVDGMVTGNKRVKVKELCVNGYLQIQEECIYADRIEVNGILKCPREISADDIEVDGYIETELLCGDNIVLNYRETRRMEKFMNFMGRKRPLKSIQQVECTQLEASAFSCAHVCAHEVTLRHHCHIDVLECDGVLRMDDTCVVDKICGNYTLEAI